MIAGKKLPLQGITVLDFGHTVMGPSCGLVLADLGADVIKVEPAPDGDPTRRLKGFGSGYFGYFNRNKRSIAIDLKTAQGQEIAHRLVRKADVLIENFAPGTMDRLGLGKDVVTGLNPRLIYASLKGFLPGPYQDRLALDEVVQMMSGLAYMTGPTGRPLRAGTSVVDITGGLFAVIAILVAVLERENSGSGKVVELALYETAVFLMGQHLCYASQSEGPIPPMPERVSAWAVYDILGVRDGRMIFVGITSDNHWERFCTQIGRNDLAEDPSLSTNNMRIEARDRLLPILAEFFGQLSMEEAVAVCDAARIPFSPIVVPEDLFGDPHLQARGGLMPTRLPNGVETALPRLPIVMPDTDLGLRSNPPPIGGDTRDILEQIGFSGLEINALALNGVIAGEGLADFPKAAAS